MAILRAMQPYLRTKAGWSENRRTELSTKADYCRAPAKIYGYVFGYVQNL